MSGRVIQLEQQNRIVGLAGRKGVGKSTKAREILEQCQRLFIFDTMGEHRWCPDSFNELDKATIYLMESHTYEGGFMARYIPEADDEDMEFAEICSEVYEQGNMMFAIEELAMLGCSPNFAPKKLKRIVRLGRHRNIDMLWTTQRLEECPISIRAATDVWVLFSHSEPNALDAIAKRCGPEVARKVAGFQGHEFLIYDVNLKKETSTVDCGCIIAEISPANNLTAVPTT